MGLVRELLVHDFPEVSDALVCIHGYAYQQRISSLGDAGGLQLVRDAEILLAEQLVAAGPCMF
jgi:hypothetical protein